MLFRTQIIFCSSELRLHFRIAEVGSLVSLNRAWRAHVTHMSLYIGKSLLFQKIYIFVYLYRIDFVLQSSICTLHGI